jgi:hypothetical protein
MFPELSGLPILASSERNLDMSTIKINKQDLIKAIAGGVSCFGDPFIGLFVSLSGELTCCEKNFAGDDLCLMSMSGMGEYVDDSGIFPQDSEYDAEAVAKYIVDDGNCLNHSAEVTQDDGTSIDYYFEIV